MPYRVVVLASGAGSLFSALIKARLKGVEVVAVLVNVSCLAKERAASAGIPVVQLSSRPTAEELQNALEEYTPHLVCCLGWNRIVPKEICSAYAGRIINSHPSLLPKHAGLLGRAVHRAVKAAGDTETGCTVHLVTEQLDAGTTLLQKTVAVEEGDTEEIIEEKVKTLERQWIPKVVEWFAAGKFIS